MQQRWMKLVTLRMLKQYVYLNERVSKSHVMSVINIII